MHTSGVPLWWCPPPHCGQAAPLGCRVALSPLCGGCSQSARNGERHFVHGETEAGAVGRVVGMETRGWGGGGLRRGDRDKARLSLSEEWGMGVE